MLLYAVKWLCSCKFPSAVYPLYALRLVFVRSSVARPPMFSIASQNCDAHTSMTWTVLLPLGDCIVAEASRVLPAACLHSSHEYIVARRRLAATPAELHTLCAYLLVPTCEGRLGVAFTRSCDRALDRTRKLILCLVQFIE